MSELERLKMSISDQILEVAELADIVPRSDIEGVALATAAAIVTEVQLYEVRK